MMLRALLVLLVVINVGVSAWWMTRAPSPREERIEQPAGVPRLQLLQEVPAKARPRVAATVAPAAAIVPTQCIAFGPFDNPALLRRAHERLRPQVALARVREVPLGTPRAWRVYIPPFPTREAAQAVADRMLAAGLDDLLVLPNGPDRHGIALGRYGSQASAERRLAQLKEAGFTAQVGPVGDVRTEGWIDVAAGAAFDAARAQLDIAAPRTMPLACTDLQ